MEIEWYIISSVIGTDKMYIINQSKTVYVYAFTNVSE